MVQCVTGSGAVGETRTHSTRIAVQAVALSSSARTAVSVKPSRLVLFMRHSD